MKALVTGGGGFLGAAVVRALVERGDEARSFSRGSYPALEALSVEQVRGDLGDADAVAGAVQGCDVVFHVAAKAGPWGPPAEFERANVTGTHNVIEACRRHGVARLVYTSSPSVVFDGSDMEGADESVPYPDQYEADYPRTKAEAERSVRQADGAGLRTVSLRPHLVWGPEDPHLLPRLAAQRRAGQLRRIEAKGEAKRVDMIWVDDAAAAHLQAADMLAENPDRVGGKAYFLSAGDPVPLWQMVDNMLDAVGLPPVERSISAGTAMFAAHVSEFMSRLMGAKKEPRITRWVARELTTSHWFDISAARRDFGWTPLVSIDEGLARLKAHHEAQAQ